MLDLHGKHSFLRFINFILAAALLVVVVGYINPAFGQKVVPEGNPNSNRSDPLTLGDGCLLIETETHPLYGTKTHAWPNAIGDLLNSTLRFVLYPGSSRRRSISGWR
jgi:hypothetical protein